MSENVSCRCRSELTLQIEKLNVNSTGNNIVRRKISVTRMSPPRTNKAAHSGFETQRIRHQRSKTGVSVAPQKDLYLLNILKRKIRVTYQSFFSILSLEFVVVSNQCPVFIFPISFTTTFFTNIPKIQACDLYLYKSIIVKLTLRAKTVLLFK